MQWGLQRVHSLTVYSLLYGQVRLERMSIAVKSFECSSIDLVIVYRTLILLGIMYIVGHNKLADVKQRKNRWYYITE